MASGSDSQRDVILPRWIRLFRLCWKLLAWIWMVPILGVIINVVSSLLIIKKPNFSGTPLGWGIDHPWITLPPLLLLGLLTLLARLALRQEQTVLSERSQSSSFNPPHVRTPIGRDKLLLELKQQLKDPRGSPVVVLHGQPGVGKTTIAAHLAHDDEICTSFSGGVLWADLGENPSLDDTLQVWAKQLHVDLSKATTTSEKIACIQGKLGHTPFLLVLDDLWLDDLKVFNPLLKMVGPGCASLITTRWRKVAEGLGNLIGSTSIFVGELGEEDTLTLLMELCQDKLTDRRMLVPIAKAAGGLPLTLQLMGGYINDQLPVASNLEQIRRKLERIENHLRLPGDADSQSLPLKEAIDIFINRLPDRKTKHAFFALGAFAPKPATFSMEAMLVVTRANRKTLQILYDRHLLHQSPHEALYDRQLPYLGSHDRYTFHQSLASAARAHLHVNDAAYSRHRNYYEKLIKQKVLIGRRKRGALKNINWQILFSDLPQIRAIRLPQRPAPIFSIFVNRYLSSITWLRWLNRLPMWLKDMLSQILLLGLSLFRRSASITGHNHFEAVLSNIQGWLYAEIGARDDALIHYEHAYKLWEHLENDRGRATVLNNLGKTYYMKAEYRRALKAYHEALDICRSQHDQASWARTLQAHTLTNIGATLDMIDRVQWAMKSYRSALSLYKDVQDDKGEAVTLHHIGTIYHELGEREEALSYLQQALAKHIRARNNAGRARTLMELGSLYLDFDSVPGQEQEQNPVEKAMEYFQQALELQKEFNDLAWQGRTLSRIGQMYARQGETAKALDAYLQALSIHQNVNYHAGLSATLGLISNLFREAGEDLRAKSIAIEAKNEHAPYADSDVISKQKSKL